MRPTVNRFKVLDGGNSEWCINPHLHFEVCSPNLSMSNAVFPIGDMSWSLFSKLAIRFYYRYVIGESNIRITDQEINWLLEHHIIHRVLPFNQLEFLPYTNLIIKSRETTGTDLFHHSLVGVLWRELAFALDEFFKQNLKIGDSKFRLLSSLRIIIAADCISSIVFPYYKPYELLSFLPLKNQFLQTDFSNMAESPILKKISPIELKELSCTDTTNEVLWVKNEITGIKMPYANASMDEKHGPDNLFSYNKSLLSKTSLEVEKNVFNCQIDQQKQDLAANKFAVLKSILAPEQVALLRKYCRELYANGYFQPEDPQEINRSFIHNEPFMTLIHAQLADIINKMLPTPVKASYSFLTRYKTGARLTKHKDRKQCTWNVSLPIDITGDTSEESWPLFLDIEGQTHSINLELGDIGIYQGSENFHWREPYLAGESMTVCFLHFVDLDFKDPLS